jgi:hypothetical protein
MTREDCITLLKLRGWEPHTGLTIVSQIHGRMIFVGYSGMNCPTIERRSDKTRSIGYDWDDLTISMLNDFVEATGNL